MSRLLTEEALADALLVRALARMVRLEADLAALSLGAGAPRELGEDGEAGGLRAVPRGLMPLAAELEDLGWVLALLTAVGQPAGAPRRAALAEVRHHPGGLAILERLATDTVGETGDPGPSRHHGACAGDGARQLDAPDRGGEAPRVDSELAATPAQVWGAAVHRWTAGGPGVYEIWESERVLGPAKADRGPEPLDPAGEAAQD